MCVPEKQTRKLVVLYSGFSPHTLALTQAIPMTSPTATNDPLELTVDDDDDFFLLNGGLWSDMPCELSASTAESCAAQDSEPKPTPKPKPEPEPAPAPRNQKRRRQRLLPKTSSKRASDADKPFQCRFCTYRSKMRSDVDTHERKHTGDKPFVCDRESCEYATAWNSNLRRHMRKHEDDPERPERCRFCMFRAALASLVTRHEQRRHAKELAALRIPGPLFRFMAIK